MRLVEVVKELIVGVVFRDAVNLGYGVEEGADLRVACVYVRLRCGMEPTD